MQTAELHNETRLSRLERLIKLYESGQTSEFLDHVIDKALAQEAADTQTALSRLDADIASYEVQYHLSSDDFLRQFKSGELGDGMDFIEWWSLLMMRDDLVERLQALTGEE